MKHRRLKPYIRRMKNSDKARDLRTAIRLEFFKLMREVEGKKRWGYVLVQHGAGGVIAVAKSKAAVKDSIVVVGLGMKRFKAWQREVKRSARKR